MNEPIIMMNLYLSFTTQRVGRTNQENDYLCIYQFVEYVDDSNCWRLKWTNNQ